MSSNDLNLKRSATTPLDVYERPLKSPKITGKSFFSSTSEESKLPPAQSSTVAVTDSSKSTEESIQRVDYKNNIEHINSSNELPLLDFLQAQGSDSSASISPISTPNSSPLSPASPNSLRIDSTPPASPFSSTAAASSSFSSSKQAPLIVSNQTIPAPPSSMALSSNIAPPPVYRAGADVNTTLFYPHAHVHHPQASHNTHYPGYPPTQAPMDPVQMQYYAQNHHLYPSHQAPPKYNYPTNPNVHLPTQGPTDVDLEAINKLKVPQLKVLLGQYQLKKSGKKQELIDRLVEYLQRTGTPFIASSVITTPTPPARKAKESKSSSSSNSNDSGTNDNGKSKSKAKAEPPKAEDEHAFRHQTAHMKTVDVPTGEQRLHYIMPAPVHADDNNQAKVVFSCTNHDAHLAASYTAVEGFDSSMTKNFSVFYNRQFSTEKKCLHHLYLSPKKQLSLTLVEHRQLFAYNAEGYQPAPVCPHCSSHAETWIWEWQKKPPKTARGSLQKYLYKHLNLEQLFTPMFADKAWTEPICLLRLCKNGHISVTRSESKSSGFSRMKTVIPRPMASPTFAHHRSQDLEALELIEVIQGLDFEQDKLFTPLQFPEETAESPFMFEETATSLEELSYNPAGWL